MEINAFQVGEAALGRTTQELAQTSHNIATQPVQQPQAETFQDAAQPKPALTQELVQLTVEQHQGQAAAKVVQAASDTVGTLVDIKA